MRRRHTGHSGRKRTSGTEPKYIFRRAALTAAAFMCVKFAWSSFPQIRDLLYDMTLVSAAMTVPEGTAELARQRFKDELLEHRQDDKDEEIRPADSIGTSPDENKDGQSASVAQQETDFDVTEPAAPPPIEDIPEENRRAIEERHYEASESTAYIPFGSGIIKNSTNLSRKQVQEYLDMPLEMTIEDTDEPQVLIMHTHATESYAEYDAGYYDKSSASWRNRDNEKNVVRLGQIITDELNSAGIATLHDKTQHDYPSYNGSYQRSEETVKKYLEQYPSIKVVIDVHRDAIQAEDGTVYKAVSEINGEKTAQVMIISGCDDGTMGMPEWDKNLRFAATLQSTMEEKYPGLTRPVFFCYRQYNQHLTNGSLLLEFGSHGNTLEECERTAHYVGRSLAQTLNGLK